MAHYDECHDLWFLQCTTILSMMDGRCMVPVSHQNVEIYLDDTASHHSEKKEHIAVNQEIQRCFREAGLFANAKECKFHQEQMGFWEWM
jgi:hypothetical protein